MNHQLGKMAASYAEQQATRGLDLRGDAMPKLNYREDSVFATLEKIETLFESFDNTLDQLEKSLAPVSHQSPAVPSPMAKDSAPQSSVPMVQQLTTLHNNLCAIGRRLEDINARVFIT